MKKTNLNKMNLKKTNVKKRMQKTNVKTNVKNHDHLGGKQDHLEEKA